jgi:hypothetical protein
MKKQPKFPFLARVKTEFGGEAMTRHSTEPAAIQAAKSFQIPGIAIVRRDVVDTRGNVLVFIEPNS